MPRAGRPCPTPGCGNLQPCPTHVKRWGTTPRNRTAVSGWEQQRRNAATYRRHGRRCYLCGAPATEVDHVIPVAEGGTDNDANRRPICKPCHRRKTAAEAHRARRRHEDEQ